MLATSWMRSHEQTMTWSCCWELQTIIKGEGRLKASTGNQSKASMVIEMSGNRCNRMRLTSSFSKVSVVKCPLYYDVRAFLLVFTLNSVFKSMRFRRIRCAHSSVLLRTEGLNASKCVRFQTKTHKCEWSLNSWILVIGLLPMIQLRNLAILLASFVSDYVIECICPLDFRSVVLGETS